MLCPKCGTKIESEHKYCPECGTKLSGEELSQTAASSEVPPLQSTSTVIKKPMPMWFKLLIIISVLALGAVTAGILFTESLVDVVDDQLKALRQDNIEQAYTQYTSKEFQSAISLEQFRRFIHTYPVFLYNHAAHFDQRSIEGNISIIKGKLASVDQVSTPIEYKLIKEDGKWKILSIRLLKPEQISNPDEVGHMEDLIEVAKAQLKEIQDGKIAEAYQQFSSKEFQEATSEEAFQEFVKRYPILTYHHVVSFHKPTIRNGVGTLPIILQSDLVAAYAKYYFIYENGGWKIWSMRILSPSENEMELEKKRRKFAGREKSEEQMSFDKMTLGDEIDADGQIKHSSTTFDSNLKDLFVDLEVKNGKKGSVVSLKLQHLESGSSIPAKAVIEEDGDTLLMSVFSPPFNGWPKGHYQLEAKTSSGLSQTVNFTVE